MNVIHRVMSNTENEWLRHQVGITVKRRETRPDRLRPQSLTPTGQLVDVFQILGWGNTKEEAERMSRKHYPEMVAT